MKLTSLLMVLLVILILPLVSAAVVPPVGDKPVLESDTTFNLEDFQEGNVEIDLVPELQPIIDTVQPLLRKLSLLVGGLFGLYLILILARVYYERKKVKLLEAIRYDLDKWNMHHNVLSSKQRKGWIRRMIQLFRNKNYDKKVHKKRKQESEK